VDVLVNNAGYSEPLPFLDAPDDAWDRVMAVNVMGVVRLTRGLGAAMLARGQGSVVMVGSVLGRTAIPGASPYIASKGAIEQLTRALGVEWARKGVRVNALAPGFMDTDMVGDESESASLRNYAERRTPMRRLGRADEVVSAALYLASDASSYVTGSVVHVDGGWTAA
jgi:NAD(P)-dependent dehydrogenase (short-subunit alcohol dehydrogenase family)